MFFSANRLINRHRETRLYVTEVIYCRTGEPLNVYLYIPEGNTEIQADVHSILYKKKLRSRHQTLYHLALHRDFTLLLMIDHQRGNHYIYCRLPVLKELFKSNDLASELIAPRLQAATGMQQSVSVDSDQSIINRVNKLTFIDTEVLVSHPEIIDTFIQNSIVVLSPYYVKELDVYTKSYIEKLQILERISSLKRIHPSSLLFNRNSASGFMSDTTTSTEEAHESLLSAALQYPADRTQVTIVTNDHVFAVRAELQGLTVIKPEPTTTESQLVIGVPNVEASILDVSIIVATDTETKLPPRSQRHHRRERQSILASVKSLFHSAYF